MKKHLVNKIVISGVICLFVLSSLSPASLLFEGKNEIFNIANTSDNATSFNTRELIKMYGYENIPLKRELDEREPLFSCDKAKKMLGYMSKYDWWELFGKQLF